MKKALLVVTAVWLLLVGASLAWNLEHEKRDHQYIALQAARSFFRQILLPRSWNAGHGGIYAVVTEEVQPNPYLKDPLRDVVTTDGLELTMLNPAYMMRQIAEIASREENIEFHLTSLKPNNPDNKATAWETEGLKSFEQGEAERFTIIHQRSGDKFRYLAPLCVEESCLKCHAEQGYKIGDIRGAITVTLPFVPSSVFTLWIGHGVTALIGLAGILFAGGLLGQSRRNLIESNKQLEKEISEHKQSGKSLRQAEREWHHTFNSMTDFVSVHDGEHRFVKVNKALADFLGKKEEELIGKHCYEVVHGTDEAWHGCPHSETMEQNRAMTIEVDDPHVGCPLLVTTSPIYDENGVPRGTIHIARDVTERKQAEKILQEHKGFLQNALDALTHPFYVIDAKDYTVKLANKAAQSTDYREGITCHSLTHKRPTPCNGDEHPCTLEEVKRTKKPTVVEHLHYDQAGEQKIYEVHAYPIFDSNGEVSQIIEYCLDINARKKAEEEKSKLEAELRQAQKMEAIGTLAGGIAHDFNNILSVIIGYADLLKFNIQSGKGVQEEEIDQVLTAGKRAKELVQQILAFSRKSEHYLQPLYPHLIVKEALKMMRSTLPATITIEQDIDTECGKIQAVSTEIHQIMVNLCTNAMQAMGPGKGVLRVSLCRKDIPADQIKESDASPGPFIVLSISDTGNGMDRETIQRIFEPYYTTKEVGKGTGLGLSTVYGIVKDLKGFIEVESEPEKGTTFQVYMPALPIGLSDSEETEQNAPLPTGAERILLVDDENSIVLMQKATLENLGYQVTATTNSLEALQNFQETPDDFDLLITDMTMPDMTGAELAQRVLSIKSGFPIILCTGFSEQIDEEKAKAIGIKEYIKKPIIIMEIATAVRQVLKAGDI